MTEANKVYLSEQLVEENDFLGKQEEFKQGQCIPMELAWNELLINATIKVPKTVNNKKVTVSEQKTILNRLKGVLRPGEFTAILGPSGSGKTTLLNFLSGRLISDNLTISGEMFLNSQRINDIDKFNDQIAYVMQDDILLATFTPREAFMFSASLRLKVSPEERIARVNQIISDLGLRKCQNTKIGNNFIRGVSGGERKRTSIGVELLTNPSLIFLDEPTTGLDSSTSLQVIELLKELAKEGRTIVSTIHQPSSEIYAVFDRLMLLVRGNIIYQGLASEALPYFAQIGFECPAFSNPSDFFMKLMNEEGLLVEKIQQGQTNNSTPEQIEEEFKQRLNHMINSFQKSEYSKDLDPKVKIQVKENFADYHVGWMTQFQLIYQRSFLNEIRNPLDVQLKIIQSVVQAVLIVIVFNNLGEYYQGIQNRSGALFSLSTSTAFGSIQGALATCNIRFLIKQKKVSSERAVFLRERINKSYSVSAYYWGKSLADLPFQILFPAITTIIVYYIIQLNTTSVDNFFICSKFFFQTYFQVLIQVLTYWYGVSYGQLLSIVITKIEVATALVPALIIPFMVLGGFFINQKNIPYVFYPLEYLSMFKYGFQASIINEFDNYTYYCYPEVPCDPIKIFNINIGLWINCLILFSLGLFLRILSYFALHKISNPNRPRLRSIADQEVIQN